MKHFRRILAALLIGVAAVIAIAFAAAPAQAEPSSRGAAAQVQQGAERVEPLGFTDCIDVLQDFNYQPTRLRQIACGVAAAGLPTTDRAIALCITGLVATGVRLEFASLACIAGAVM